MLALRRLCDKQDGPLDEKSAMTGAGLKPVDVPDLRIVAVGFLKIISGYLALQLNCNLLKEYFISNYNH